MWQVVLVHLFVLVPTVWSASLHEVFPGWGDRGGNSNRAPVSDINRALQERFIEDAQIRQEQERQGALCFRFSSMLNNRSKMTSQDWESVRENREEPCLKSILPVVVDFSLQGLSGEKNDWLDSLKEVLCRSGGDVALFLGRNYLSDASMQGLKNYIAESNLKSRLILLDVHSNALTQKGKSVVREILELCEQEAVAYV